MLLQTLFTDQDTDKNGFLNFYQFSRIVNYGLNYHYLPVYTIQSMYSRYGTYRGINIDKFMLAVAKLHVSNRIYEQNKMDGSQFLNFSRANWMNFSIAF